MRGRRAALRPWIVWESKGTVDSSTRSEVQFSPVGEKATMEFICGEISRDREGLSVISERNNPDPESTCSPLYCTPS